MSDVHFTVIKTSLLCIYMSRSSYNPVFLYQQSVTVELDIFLIRLLSVSGIYRFVGVTALLQDAVCSLISIVWCMIKNLLQYMAPNYDTIYVDDITRLSSGVYLNDTILRKSLGSQRCME